MTFRCADLGDTWFELVPKTGRIRGFSLNLNNWIKLGQTSSNCIKIDQIGSNWIRWVQIGSIYLDQIQCKQDQIVSNWFNLVLSSIMSQSWTKSFLVLYQNIYLGLGYEFGLPRISHHVSVVQATADLCSNSFRLILGLLWDGKSTRAKDSMYCSQASHSGYDATEKRMINFYIHILCRFQKSK